MKYKMRILVNIPDGIWRIIEKELKGKIGTKNSEIIRNIVIAYIAEKGYFKATLMSNDKLSEQTLTQRRRRIKENKHRG